jgi:hypothetical protein
MRGQGYGPGQQSVSRDPVLGCKPPTGCGMGGGGLARQQVWQRCCVGLVLTGVRLTDVSGLMGGTGISPVAMQAGDW